MTSTFKRAAENSPENANKKRSAFGDLTNAISCTLNVSKLTLKVGNKKCKTTKDKPAQECKPESKKDKVVEENINISAENLTASSEHSLSQENSQYFSAVEDGESDSTEDRIIKISPEIEDFDKENLNDIFSESNYAMEIFKYYKQREVNFKIKKYIDLQPELTKGMRAILVDWMVEVQENFELNHETLYLAVKLVDHYLMKHTVPKATLQLVGATAIFIASKFDERCPPLIDDFLYICDDSYSRKELIAMEVNILKTMEFQLGVPLSYRFLRRYARCAKISLETLTLARYILETSLLEYDFVDVSESLIAAASLFLALKMKNIGVWTSTLQYYSGYSKGELLELVYHLNSVLIAPSHKNLQTIRAKYSHRVFFEVASISPLNLKIEPA